MGFSPSRCCQSYGPDREPRNPSGQKGIDQPKSPLFFERIPRAPVPTRRLTFSALVSRGLHNVELHSTLNLGHLHRQRSKIIIPKTTVMFLQKSNNCFGRRVYTCIWPAIICYQQQSRSVPVADVRRASRRTKSLDRRLWRVIHTVDPKQMKDAEVFDGRRSVDGRVKPGHDEAERRQETVSEKFARTTHAPERPGLSEKPPRA